MSGPVCYLARADRGGRLARVRLIRAGAGDESVHDLPAEGDDALAVRTGVEAAARWIADELARAQGAGPRTLRLLVLDADGARCEWLSAPGVDEPVVAAAMAQAEGLSATADGVGSASAAPTGGPWAPPTTDEWTLQALGARAAPRPARTDAGDAAQRLAVLSVPDVPARLLVDALDDMGVAVERALSLWHAAALAWDAPAPASADGPEVVAAVAPVVGIVLIDPASARLLWCWSRGGELQAAGSMRVPAGEDQLVRLAADDAARLATDWLAWSAQLGVAPARLVVLAPPLGPGGDPTALSAPELGAALGRAWPGASIDLAQHEDPVGATLSRLARADAAPAEATADRRRSLVGLSGRPGRAHKALYRWAFVGLTAGALALAAVASQAYSAAGALRAQAAQSRRELSERIVAAAPPKSAIEQATAQDSPASYLAELVRRERERADPTDALERPVPVLQELNAISFVLGTPDLEIRDLQFNALNVYIDLLVPDTQTADFIKEALDNSVDTSCTWTRQISAQSAAEGKLAMTLIGEWRKRPPAPAPGRSGP